MWSPTSKIVIDELPDDEVPDANTLLSEAEEHDEKDETKKFCEKMTAFATAILREFFLKHFNMLLRSQSAEKRLLSALNDGCPLCISLYWLDAKNATEWEYCNPPRRDQLFRNIDFIMHYIDECDVEKVRLALDNPEESKLKIKPIGGRSIKVGPKTYFYNYEVYALEGADEQSPQPDEVSAAKVDENIRKRRCDSGLFNESGGSSSSSSSSDRQKLFAELNKGEPVTSGLRKVTDDMKMHKNPALRAQSTVSASSPPSKSLGSSPGAKPKPVDRPPKTELKDNKVWNVEYHKDNENIMLNTDVKQDVYMFRCEQSVIQINGKVNSVMLNSCKKTSVVFDNLLAQVEVINSQGIKVQTLGMMPSISIQKTDGCQVYLSKDSLEAEIVISKSSEIKILAPCGEDGDFVEFPVPEQLKVTLSVEKKKLNTVVSDIV